MTKLLAILTVAAWIITGFLTRHTSIHVPLAIVSIALIALAFAVDGPHLISLLQFRVSDVIIGLAGGLVLALLTRVAYLGARAASPELGAHVDVLYRTMRAAPPLELLLPVLVVIIACEEIVFRGVLVRDRRSAVLSVIAYTIAQLGAPSLLLAPIALGCGVLWSAERLWRGGLIAPYLTHLTWSLLTLVYFPLDGPLM